jgi:hypothetical protein
LNFQIVHCPMPLSSPCCFIKRIMKPFIMLFFYNFTLHHCYYSQKFFSVTHSLSSLRARRQASHQNKPSQLWSSEFSAGLWR